METCFFTIIIPTFNAGKFLPGALKSILNQNFSDFEILVMDGLSSDHTINIAKEASSFDNRIRVISQKDSGIYDAMNKGIHHAKGEWVYFLGSDDRLKGHDVLNLVKEKAERSKVDFIYGDALVNNKVYDGPFSYEKLLRKNICHQAIFFRRTVFDLCGDYNISFKLHADWDLNLRIFRSVNIKTEYINLVVAYFGEGGVSAQHDVPFLRNSLIPAKIDIIKRTRNPWRSVAEYDQWWRIVRNARIRSIEMIREAAGVREVPAALLRIVACQGRISTKLLKYGVFSKTFMLLSFLREFSIKSR